MHPAVTATYSDVILCRRSEGDIRAGICLFRRDELFAQNDLISILHPSERHRYDDMQYEKRRKSYLIGRYTAKRALAVLLHEKELSIFNIHSGIFNQPIVSYEGAKNVQVSISHSNDFGAALAFPEVHPMAIDIEKINNSVSDAIQTQLTAREMEYFTTSPCSQELHSMILWTAKEALSKTLKTGLTIPMSVLEVERVEKDDATYTSYFRNFGQYKAISIPLELYVCTLICPRKTEIVLDINKLRMCFA